VQRDHLDERVVRTVAPNGLTVVTEELPGLRSAAVGIWVRAASAHEARAQMGAAHLLEHLVFKGTERRPASELARELEVRGGSLDAYTSRDHTSFQAHVLDEDVPLAIDILTDLVRRPLLRQSDLELERQVVLEEIRSIEDTPDDLVFELHSAALWPDHPYGYSILGTEQTVSSLTAVELRAVHRAGYYPANCLVAAAGNLDHDRVMDSLTREGWLAAEGPSAPLAPVTAGAAARGSEDRIERPTAQSHIVFGTDTFEARDPRRYGLAILTNVLGGGMSSRLFQKVREELGLAYAVYAFQHFYRASGLIGVYVGTQAETAELATQTIRAELARLAAEGLSEAELDGGRRQLRGQLMLALENPASRMHRLAMFGLNDDHYRPLDSVLAAVEAVGRDDAAALAAEFFQPERQVVVRLGR
jgi:predicted Zn-dependent peptidase